MRLETSSHPYILVSDVTGAPHGWITWQTALAYLAAERIHRQLGAHEFKFKGGVNARTGTITSAAVNSIIALKGRNPKAWEHLPPALSNHLLFRRDRNTCCYCGTQLHAGVLTRDHIKPFARGGDDSWMNVVTACKRCNNHKGSRLPHEAGLELLYVPYIPSRCEGLILRNRRILADQMDFLVKFVPKDSRVHYLS